MRHNDEITYGEDGDANRYHILDNNKQWMLALLHNGKDIVSTQRETMRRLVACWNTCRGLSINQLEQIRFPIAEIYSRNLKNERLLHLLLPEVKEVIRISDRDHEAWNKVKELIKEIEDAKAQRK